MRPLNIGISGVYSPIVSVQRLVSLSTRRILTMYFTSVVRADIQDSKHYSQLESAMFIAYENSQRASILNRIPRTQLGHQVRDGFRRKDEAEEKNNSRAEEQQSRVVDYQISSRAVKQQLGGVAMHCGCSHIIYIDYCAMVVNVLLFDPSFQCRSLT